MRCLKLASGLWRKKWGASKNFQLLQSKKNFCITLEQSITSVLPSVTSLPRVRLTSLSQLPKSSCPCTPWAPATLPRAHHSPTYGKNSPKVQKAFEDSKRLLTNAANLNFPDPKAPLALTCDASLVALGATLEQFVGGCWRPLGYWSKSLKPDKQRWTSFRRGTLAVQQALRYFHNDIAGRHVVIYSDCKALCQAFKSTTSQDHDPLARAHLIENGRVISVTWKPRKTSWRIICQDLTPSGKTI